MNKLIVRPDYLGDASRCDPDDQAELSNFHKSDIAELIVCPIGLGEGGIEKGYGSGSSRIHQVDCNTIGSLISDDMETLGSVFIHEFTHWESLISPPLKSITDDHGYGTYDAFTLDKSKSLSNADNYAWFANEVFWTVKCKHSFSDPKC